MTQRKKPTVRFLPYDKVVELINSEQSVLDMALKAKLGMNHSCGGNGSCGTCRVIVCEGLENLAQRNEVEAELAEAYGYEPEERLSCQITPQGDLTVKVPQSDEPL